MHNFFKAMLVGAVAGSIVGFFVWSPMATRALQTYNKPAVGSEHIIPYNRSCVMCWGETFASEAQNFTGDSKTPQCVLGPESVIKIKEMITGHVVAEVLAKTSKSVSVSDSELCEAGQIIVFTDDDWSYILSTIDKQKALDKITAELEKFQE